MPQLGLGVARIIRHAVMRIRRSSPPIEQSKNYSVYCEVLKVGMSGKLRSHIDNQPCLISSICVRESDVLKKASIFIYNTIVTLSWKGALGCETDLNLLTVLEGTISSILSVSSEYREARTLIQTTSAYLTGMPANTHTVWYLVWVL